jgi:hypothetical protein
MLALHSDPIMAMGAKGNTLWNIGSHEDILPRPEGKLHVLRGQVPQVTITAAGTHSADSSIVVDILDSFPSPALHLQS